MQDVCLFAHFDKDGTVDDYVLWYLSKIKELYFSIVFISTAELSQADIERLRANCCDVIVRHNTGLDFGSWSAGFAKHHLSIDGRLLLANDSVYGPIGNLATAFKRVTRSPADFYGLVESAEFAPHLQSWFLLFEPWVVRNAEFKAILSQPFSGMTKTQIIANGEVSLSRRLVDAGFRYETLYSISRAGLSTRLHAMNPMHLLWRELLSEEGVPFLKIELLRDNPFGIEDAARILQFVETLDESCYRLVRSHLARTTGSPRRRQRPLLARYRYALIRERYRVKRENRYLAAAWNLIKLEMLTPPILVWRSVRTLLGIRRDGT